MYYNVKNIVMVNYVLINALSRHIQMVTYVMIVTMLAKFVQDLQIMNVNNAFKVTIYKIKNPVLLFVIHQLHIGIKKLNNV